MRHRHLNYPASTRPVDLPSAAIVDLLDRGDLGDWLPLLQAVVAEPSGPLAERIAALVDAFPMYGTSALWRAWLNRLEPQAEELPLDQLRRRRALTQAQLATTLGISQSDVSKLERRSDLKVSTLRHYLAAVGGRLHLVADVEGRPIRLRLPAAD